MNFRMHVEEQPRTCGVATPPLIIITLLPDLTMEHLGRETILHSE